MNAINRLSRIFARQKLKIVAAMMARTADDDGERLAFLEIVDELAARIAELDAAPRLPARATGISARARVPAPAKPEAKPNPEPPSA